jgi:uncharacterized protein YtpQ (UPF0354 family)
MGFFDNLLGRPSKAHFGRRLAEALRQAGETVPIRYDQSSFRLVAEGEDQRELHLSAVYDEFCSAQSAERESVFRNIVRGWFAYRKEVPSQFEDVHPDLLPVVRSRSFFELTRLRTRIVGSPNFGWPYQIIGDHLAVGLAYDLPEAMIQIQEHHLTAWEVGFDQALAAASANLLAISPPTMQAVRPGLWISAWSDSYGAARLLLHDLLRTYEVRGDPVVMVPNRDLLLLTGSADEEGLAAMAAIATKAVDHPRPNTAVAFTLLDEDWQPFLPEPQMPVYEALATQRLLSLGQDYAEQKQYLDELHKKTGEDIWVAPFDALRDKASGRVVSHCLWTRGVESLLPRTDLVHFAVPKSDKDCAFMATASWDRVVSHLGSLITPVGLWPERFRVTAFPSDEQLTSLGVAYGTSSHGG